MSEQETVRTDVNAKSSQSTSQVPAKKEGSPQAVQTTSSKSTPEFTIPLHLLGHDPNNPAANFTGSGRYGRMQKPRPGVKVPYRNLTSQIVTQDEIAQELLERSLKKYPYKDLAAANNLILTMKLAQRFGNRNTSTATSHTVNKEQSNRSRVQIPDNSPIRDTDELLSILSEGSENSREQGSSSTNQNSKPETKPSLPPISSPYKFIKLYPELEKELALKQLSEFSQPRKKKELKPPENKIKKKRGEKLDNKKAVIKKQIGKIKNAKNNSSNGIAKKNKNKTQIAVTKGKPVRKRKLVDETLVIPKRKRYTKNTNGNLVTSAVELPISSATTVDVSLITDVPNVEDGSLPVVPPIKENRYIKKYVNKKLLSRSSSSLDLVDTVANGVNGTDETASENNENSRSEANLGNTNPKIKKTIFSKGSDVGNDLKQKSHAVDIDNNSVKSLNDTSGGKKKSRVMREIERLLGDEGAINMLYSVEQKRTPGNTPNRRGILPSSRRKKKDLLLKTRLVKNAVLRLSNSPSQTLGKTALRVRRDSNPQPTPVINAPTKPEFPQRKLSVESRDSHQSTSVMNSPVHSPSFSYPSKLSVPAEASRIIRRHSSSSSYSSRSNSPRRPSLDADRPLPSSSAPSSPEKPTSPESDSSFQRKMLQLSLEKSSENTPASSKSSSFLFNSRNCLKTSIISELSDRAVRLASMNKHKLLKPEELNAMLRKATGNKESDTALVFKKDMHTKLNAEISRTIRKNLLAAKMHKTKKRFDPSDNECYIKALTSGDSSSAVAATCISEPSTSAMKRNESAGIATPLSSTADGYSNLVKTITSENQKKKEGESEKPRSSIRQSTGSHSYKEISIRRYDHLVQIILTPISTKMKNAFNMQVFKEMSSILACLRKDESCRVVLLTSTGSAFCYGIDITALLQPTPEKRKAAAIELVLSMKEFIKSLATFNKPLIAGVHGAAVGLGVTMLPFFDMVFASDKATFHTPYARLGQVPEGAATLTLPQMLGNAVTSELLFGCRKLTASEALHFGLVTRILWPARFQEELIPLIRGIATQSSQSMEATKALLRHSLCTKLDAALLSESQLLLQHWTSNECQTCFKQYLEEETPTMQK